MKKITDFIVNNRYIILVLFIILAVVSIFVSKYVNINYDISKYLPNTSETRIGMDIMENEFDEIKSSYLNIMFENLNEEEKIQIYNELTNIDGVSSVDYDETENYNKENYTLYVVNIDDTSDSELAANVYEKIKNNYKDYTFYKGGEIADRNEPVLPTQIVVLAVGCALIILIIMSESYVEPFLFLISIFIAVLLNNGTNIIFGTVSNITSSISTILQMALSMDYSIMLMNRYRQEREKESDKVIAMKNALYNAFKAISSSSITTIVGLLALVFMSFTIGRDLGFVLAKGVLFSLLCIFLVLPCLILMFDKLIEKTKKKSPNFKMNKLGSFAYKIKPISLVLFIGAFVGCYFLKGNLGISYTETTSNEINKIFTDQNQIALIYKSEDEAYVSKYLDIIENEEKVDEVLGYGNTINQELKYDELNDKLKDFDIDTDIEEYMLKIIYYNYYNQDEDNTISFNDFVEFVKNDVYQNPKISDKIDEKTREDIDRLSNFTNSTSINKKRSVNEIAKILEIDTEDVNDILIYYNSKINSVKMTLDEFIKFVNKDVLTSKKYSVKMDNNVKNDIDKISKFVNKSTIQKEMTSKEMSNLVGIAEDKINDLYTYYLSLQEVNETMTISEFSNFVLKNVLEDSDYGENIDDQTIVNINLLATFSNNEIINKKMSTNELSSLFGIDENIVKQLYLVCELPEDYLMTPYELITIIVENETLKNNLDETLIEKIELISNIMESSINQITYSYNDLAQLIGMDKSNIKDIYTLYVLSNSTLKMTPKNFVDFILENKNNSILSDNLDKNTINELTLVQNVMNSVINKQKYTSKEIAKMFNIDASDVELLYGLYNYTYINKNQKISLLNFIDFILDDVINNADYSNYFDSETKKNLNTIDAIMQASLEDIKYTKNEIFAILSNLSNNLDKDQVDLFYVYYGSSNEYNANWTITIEKFVNYLNEDILNDGRFDDFIEDNVRDSILDAKDTVLDAKNLLVGNKYSRVVINTKLDAESDETFEFIQNIKNDMAEELTEFYVIGDSPMAYEMSQTFQSEMDFITVLTMIAIFIVVVVTFKSIIIPLILVLLIQCAVYMTMGILSVSGESVYFIALLIVQSILMGATIDYAILYTTYYVEHRKTMDIKESIINSYNKAIHTILTSASILIIVTLIVGNFASAIAAKICQTISKGTLCSSILILFLLPAVLAACDKIIIKNKK